VISRHLTSIDSTALMTAWKQRVAEIVPDNEFEVTLQGNALRIRGTGVRTGTQRVSVADPILNLPLPASQRLRLFFSDECHGLERFITDARGEPWPGHGADLHVRVDSKSVRIWWGSDDEMHAVLRVKPLTRQKMTVS
jgi:hypothetical protein